MNYNLNSTDCMQENCPPKQLPFVADSYSVRDARLHLRHVRDLLRSVDPADAYNGVNGSSLSYLSFYTKEDKGDAVR